MLGCTVQPMTTSATVAGVDELNPKRWWSLLALCTLTGLVWLTATDISISLPTIGRELGGSMDTLQWAVNGYFLAGSLIVLGGRLSDMRGRRRIFIIGGSLLILGSVVAGSASSTAQLVVGRVIEGVGAAAILPSSLAMVAVGFPENERARAIAIWIAVAWGGQGIGPLIGGGLIEAFGWQAIFWINLPLGLAAIWLVLKTTPESFNTRKGAKLDVPGAVVLTAALVSLSYGLVSVDNASGSLLAALFGGSIALFALFVLIESRASEPLVPLSVFRRPAFMGAVSANLLANIIFSAVIFIMALYLQVVMGYGALKAGALLLPATLVVLAVNVLGEHLTQRQVYRMPIALGMILLGVGCVLLTGLGGSYASLLPGFILVGAGIGLQITPATELAVGSSGVGEGVASGVFKATSMIGGSLGVAVGTAIFQNFAGKVFEEPANAAVLAGTVQSKLLDVLVGSQPTSTLSQSALNIVYDAFDSGGSAAMIFCAIVAALGAALAYLLLRGAKTDPEAELVAS